MDVLKLVKKAKRGNKEALLKLIMSQKNDYYKLAYTYLGNQHDSMDAVEEMIISIYENIHQLKKDESFYSWSKTILVNTCKNQLRKREKLVLVEEWQDQVDIEKEHSISGDPILQSEQQMDIQQLLQHLNEHQAEAIKLKYLLDLDYQSISEITNVSVGTVKSRVFQGLKKLKDLYGGNDNE